MLKQQNTSKVLINNNYNQKTQQIVSTALTKIKAILIKTYAKRYYRLINDFTN